MTDRSYVPEWLMWLAAWLGFALGAIAVGLCWWTS